MDRPPREAVLAGTQAFTVALLAPVTARVGTRPRIAADAVQALGLCRGPDGVVVLEYAGDASLPAIERLLREGRGVRVVVAVAPEHGAAEPALRSLGVLPVRWEGRPEDVVRELAGARADLRRAQGGASAIAVVGPDRLVAGSPPGDAPPDPGAEPAGLGLEPAAMAQRTAWPASTPDAAEAADALLRSLAGALPAGAPLAEIAAQVVAGLSALEREVLAGDPQPFDPAPVRAAAVMRLRVAAALAAAPLPGAPVDGDALRGILGEIDDLLAEVKGLLGTAPEEARLGLEAVRNALVREAIEFSEAAGGRASGPAATPVPSARPRPAARPVAARAPPRSRRPSGLLVLLALAAAGAVAYHGWRLYDRPRPQPPPTFQGAPAGTLGVDRGSSRVLMALPGARIDPAELERFRRLEATRGNAVRAVSPGTWVIEPAAASGEGAP